MCLSRCGCLESVTYAWLFPKRLMAFTFMFLIEWIFPARQVLLAYKVRHRIEEFYRDVKQNLGLEAYQMRSGRGAIIHWHLVFCAHTLLTVLKKTAVETDKRLAKSLATLGDVCRWVKNQCSRKLVDWLYQKFKHKAKPQTIYQMLKI